jgi:hypothetical protein
MPSESANLPPPPPPPRPRHFYKGRILVLSIERGPGPIYSTASPPPTGAPIHPFLSARAYDPYSEDELGSLLRRAESFDQLIGALLDAGYDMTSTIGSPPPELGHGYRLSDQRGLAGAAWESTGLFTPWSPGEPVPLEHAVVTSYRDDQDAPLLRLAAGAGSFGDLSSDLTQAGYDLCELPEYTI